MQRNVFVFVPDSLKYTKHGYLEGAHEEFDDCEAFYITSRSASTCGGALQKFVGYVGSAAKCKLGAAKGVCFDPSNHNPILMNHHDVRANVNVIKITYDYEGFTNSDVVNSEDEYYGVHFSNLCENLRRYRTGGGTNGQRGMLLVLLAVAGGILAPVITAHNKIRKFTGYSATISHFHDSLVTLNWMLNEMLLKRKVTPKIGNVLVSKLLDVAIGLVLLSYFLQYESSIVESIVEFREVTLHNLRSLLTYLMGAPIGLKLNYAFNKYLATFFFYHVILWRIFLHAIQPIIAGYFLYFVLPGALGFSFQIAMLSDVIAIATFHIFCVHVYAVKLMHLQLKGLLSLWRLFIGRKFNPLRQRVDSFQYSQHQLFVGTLGFTVLLFLLPTTAVYYTVFIVFRLAVVLVDQSLCRIRHLLNCLPIYVTLLWLFKSSSLAGTVNLKCHNIHGGIGNFEANLNTLPLIQSIQKFTPEIVKPEKPFSWTKVVMATLVDRPSSKM